ncbi:MAG: 16S rRNA (adenine(1518)-N(6)/adenine(1519)-N(6))-dimethyltransferase RsmA [Pseudomonadales bacterium]
MAKRDPLLPHQPRKRFGQNFLHDGNIIDKIVRSVSAKVGEHIVEIGPGKGAITEGLIKTGAKLDVIELDRDLIPWLKLQFGLQPQFNIISADALTVDFGELAEDKPLRIVGNLPYNISTPLIFHLLSFREHVEDMHFMLQKEVVDRMAAVPGTKAWGRLGIMVQYYCEVQPLFPVPPGCFNPPPKVNSAVVRLKVRDKPQHEAKNAATLERVVAIAFQQRRKTLRNALMSLASEQQLASAEIDSKLRPENLSLEDFVRLANKLDEI